MVYRDGLLVIFFLISLIHGGLSSCLVLKLTEGPVFRCSISVQIINGYVLESFLVLLCCELQFMVLIKIIPLLNHVFVSLIIYSF